MASGVTFDNGAVIGIVGNSYGGFVKIRKATVDLGGVTSIGDTLYVGEGLDGTNNTNLGTLTVNSAGTILTVGAHVYIGSNGGAGVLHLKNGATLDVKATTLPSTDLGPLTLADGVGSAGTLNIGGTLNGPALAAGTLNTASITFGAGTGIVNFNHTNTTTGLTFAPTIYGEGTINAAAGITKLSGNSSGFTGDVFVKGGTAAAGDGATVLIDGALPFGTSAASITVEADGKLAVASNIGGAITVANGGTLAGNQGPTRTVGSLTLNETSQLSLGLGAPSTTSLFNISGAFILDGQLSIADLGGFEEGTYTLFSYGGTFTNAGLTILSLPPGFNPGDWAITSDSDEVFLQVAVGSGKQYWDGGNQSPGAEGGSGTWNSSTTNWTNVDGSVNAAWASERAVFAGTAGTVIVEGTQTFTGLIFEVAGYNVAAGTSGSLAITAMKDATITANEAAAIGASISGANGLVKLGIGALTLSGISTYAGRTTVQAGTLFLANTGSVSVSSGVDVASGASFDVSSIGGPSTTIGSLSGAGGVNVGSKTLITTISAPSAFGGAVSGTGDLQKQGSGTLTFGSTATASSLTSIEVASGTLALAGGDNIGNATRVGLTGANTALVIAAAETIGALDGVTESTVTQTAGALTLNGSTPSASFAGVISGVGTLVKSGTGTQILTGDNTYATSIASGTVATTVAGGILQVTDGGSITHTTGVTVVGTTNVAASLEIVNGVVSSREGRIATTAGTNGSVTVGADATWNNTRALSIGTSGTGSLTIENGGDVTSQTGVIGGGSSSSGLVVLSGVGSTWTTELGIAVGGTGGTGGTLTIRDGGTVTNTDVFKGVDIGVNSAVNIGAVAGSAAAAAGALNVASIQLKNSTSILNFNHTSESYTLDSSIYFASTGSLNVHAGTTMLTGEITGSGNANQAGKINVHGGATLVLNGDGQSFTGATRLYGGTLELANSGALGSSLVVISNFFEIDPFNVKVEGGGVIDFASNVTIAAGIQFNSLGSMNVDSGTSILSGLVGGTFGITKTGTGNLILSGNNSQHSGGMSITAGALSLQTSASAGTGSITFAPSAASTLRVQTFSLNNNLLGLGFDDQIDLQGLTFANGAVITSLNAGVLTVSQGATSLTLKFGDLSEDVQFKAMEDTDGSTVLALVARPVVTAFDSSPAHTEDGPGTPVAPGLTISDADSTNLTGATVTITDRVAGDALAFADQNGITGSYNAGSGVLTLTGTASVADYQTALRSITYSSTSDNPATGAGNTDRVISFAVADGDLTSSPSDVTLSVANANDAPVLDANTSPELTGIAEDTQAPSNGSTAGSTLVSALLAGAPDVDTGALQGLAITGVSTKGSLFYSIDGGASWSELTGSVSATSALVLHSDARVSFQPNMNENGLVSDAVTFKAWDRSNGVANGTTGVDTTSGTAFSAASDTAAVTISAVNDAPVLADRALALNPVDEDAGAPTSTVGTLISTLVGGVSDVDTGAAQGLAIIGADASNGTWYYTIDGGANWQTFASPSAGAARLLAADAGTRVYFRPNPDYQGTVSAGLTIRAWDATSGANGGTADATTTGGTSAFSATIDTVSVTVNNVNDAPTLSGGPVVLTGTNENATSTSTLVSTILAQVARNDIEPSTALGVAVTSATGNGTWQYSTNGASWTAFGTVSDATALLLSSTTRLRYVPDLQNGETPVLTFRAWDQSSGTASANGAPQYGDGSTNGGTTAYSTGAVSAQMTVTSVNDAPIATNLTQAKGFTEDGGAVALDAIVVTEVDTGDTVTATLTLSNAAAGTLSTGTFGSVTSTYTAGTGVWMVTGTVADVNAALAAVAFTPAANWEQSVTIATQIRDSLNTGPANGTITLTATPSNDAPSATHLTQAKGFTEDAGAVALDAIVVSDIDAGETVTATLTLSNAAAGSLPTGTFGAATASYTAGTGLWTVTGSLADVNTALAAVTFTPAQNWDKSVTITTRIRDAAGAGPADGTLTLIATPQPDAPVITNNEGGATAAISFAENSTAPVTRVTATDADGDSLTSSLSGEDAALFSISSTGELTFKVAPDFEAPADAGKDNIYNVTVTASDALGGSDTQTLTIQVADANDVPLATPGKDLFQAGAGDEQFDGLAGVDVVRFAINASDAVITYNADGTVTVSGAGIGADTLTNIELLRFADQVVLVDRPEAPPLQAFDEAAYLARYSDVAAAVQAGQFTSGQQHFLLFGAEEGRSPDGQGIAWNEAFYLSNNPDVAAAVQAGQVTSGYQHYQQFGSEEEGRIADPEDIPGWHESFYLAQNPDVAAAVQAGQFTSGYQHYQLFGSRADEGRSPSELFDEAWYLATNTDVEAAVQAGTMRSGWDHYRTFGWREDRNPSSWFDVSDYLARNPDVAAAGVDPLAHYLNFGAQEGRIVTAADLGLWA